MSYSLASFLILCPHRFPTCSFLPSSQSSLAHLWSNAISLANPLPNPSRRCFSQEHPAVTAPNRAPNHETLPEDLLFYGKFYLNSILVTRAHPSGTHFLIPGLLWLALAVWVYKC